MVEHKLIITGIIALAAGPAPNKPDTRDVIIIITISRHLGFVILFCKYKAISFNIPVCDTIPAKNKGLRLALVSTSRRKFIEILLSKLNIKDMFEIVISREDVKKLKPDPEAYNKALSILNISCDNCIAIEDSERGIKASKGANIKTIQVNDFIKNKTNNIEISEKLSRILLSIINFTME